MLLSRLYGKMIIFNRAMAESSQWMWMLQKIAQFFFMLDQLIIKLNFLNLNFIYPTIMMKYGCKFVWSELKFLKWNFHMPRSHVELCAREILQFSISHRKCVCVNIKSVWEKGRRKEGVKPIHDVYSGRKFRAFFHR